MHAVEVPQSGRVLLELPQQTSPGWHLPLGDLCFSTALNLGVLICIVGS